MTSVMKLVLGDRFWKMHVFILAGIKWMLVGFRIDIKRRTKLLAFYLFKPGNTSQIRNHMKKRKV